MSNEPQSKMVLPSSITKQTNFLGEIEFGVQKISCDKLIYDKFDEDHGLLRLRAGSNSWLVEFDIGPEGMEFLRRLITKDRLEGNVLEHQGEIKDKFAQQLADLEDQFRRFFEWQIMFELKSEVIDKFGKRTRGLSKDETQLGEDLLVGFLSSFNELRQSVSTQPLGVKFVSELLRSENEDWVRVGLTLTESHMRGGLQDILTKVAQNEKIPRTLRDYSFGLLYRRHQIAVNSALLEQRQRIEWTSLRRDRSDG